jgi:hypothetical protein
VSRIACDSAAACSDATTSAGFSEFDGGAGVVVVRGFAVAAGKVAAAGAVVVAADAVGEALADVVAAGVDAAEVVVAGALVVEAAASWPAVVVPFDVWLPQAATARASPASATVRRLLVETTLRL